MYQYHMKLLYFSVPILKTAKNYWSQEIIYHTPSTCFSDYPLFLSFMVKYAQFV